MKNLKVDQQWLQQLTSDEKRIFEELYEKYRPQLILFAAHILKRDPLLVEDIVQQVLYRLWEIRYSFSSEEHVKRFLFVAVRNACLNYLRDKQTRVRHMSAIIKLSPAEERSVEYAIIRAESQQKVSQLLDFLSPGEQLVLRKLFFEEKKPVEVAAELKLSVNNVNQIKYQALVKLRLKHVRPKEE